jgi:hypothetical protein
MIATEVAVSLCPGVRGEDGDAFLDLTGTMRTMQLDSMPIFRVCANIRVWDSSQAS